MKQGAAINKFIMLFLLGAVVIYLGVSAWNSWTNPFSTYLSYAYSSDDRLEVTGFVVREEFAVTGGENGTVDLLPEEGEKVARGDTVALIYHSEAALERKQQIQALSLEREQLQYALQHLDGSGDGAQLSAQVTQTIAQLHADVAAGDLTGLEDAALSLRSLVYKRESAYSGADAAAALAASIQSVDAQLSALSAQSAQDTRRITVSQSGCFSGQSDGYEALFTPELLETITPAELDRLSHQGAQPDADAVGKLITSPRWYFVCPVSESDALRLKTLSTITVRFSRDWSGEVEMEIERLSDAENGQRVLVLSTDRYLSSVTLLRGQTVELIFARRTGIRVPKAALRVEERTVTDAETGAETQVQITGVYALVGAQAEFKPVTVLEQEDEYCLVEPAPTTQSEVRKNLRAGDEIIVAAEDLFDGKVVR